MQTIIPSQFRPFVFFILIVNVSGRAQIRRNREKYFTAGFNATALGASIDVDNPILKNGLLRSAGFIASEDGRNGYVLAANTSFGINTGFMWQDKNSKNFTSIQAEFQRNRSTYIFNNPYSYTVTITPAVQDHDADDTVSTSTTKYANWAENDSYLKYSLSLQRFWYQNDHSILKGDTYFYIKESFGQTFLHRNHGGEIKQGDTETAINDTNSVVATTIAYNPVSFILGSEIGFRAFSENKDRSLDIGLLWNQPFASTFKREYDFYSGKKLVASDQISFTGASILLNATYSFNGKIKQRPMDSTKLNREKIDLLAKSHTENGRNFEVQQKITLNTDLVTAEIWDRGTVDGDIITLFLNGENILDNFTTSKKKKEVVLHLKEGANYLVMHAENLGTMPPNTACFDIEDGTKRRSISINSDMKRSGALEIIYKPALQ